MQTDINLPFFDAPHHSLAAMLAQLDIGSGPASAAAETIASTDACCRDWVARLARLGLLAYAVPAAHGGALAQLDARALCLLREYLAFHDGLADFAFAMQGLGSGAITLAGSAAQQQQFLPPVARGEAIAAFALSEPLAGSDVAAMTTTAVVDGEHFVLDGAKTWISNGGIADFYCVFARSAAGRLRDDGSVSAQGISAFIVPAATPGLEIAERIKVIAPHPLARLRLHQCRVPRAFLLGEVGDGFKIAMRTLDIFRSSVAAAALGFARRAFSEARRHALQRRMFGRTLAEFQLSQAALADMVTAIDSATLLTYRAAWLRDRGEPATQAAAMAKLVATENAQQVIDRAVQMLGGEGVRRGSIVEKLYREIRALRIYEGASEVQKLIIARELLK